MYELFLSESTIEFLKTQPIAKQKKLWRQFRLIRSAPAASSNRVIRDRIGRDVDINFFENYIISYWADATDDHSRILSIELA